MRGEAKGLFKAMRNLKFFIIFFIDKTMRIIHLLWKALQLECQDILNALTLVSSTTKFIQELKEDGWDDFLI